MISAGVIGTCGVISLSGTIPVGQRLMMTPCFCCMAVVSSSERAPQMGQLIAFHKPAMDSPDRARPQSEAVEAVMDRLVADQFVAEPLLIPPDRLRVVAPGMDFPRALLVHLVHAPLLQERADAEGARLRENADEDGLGALLRAIPPVPAAESQNLPFLLRDPALFRQVDMADGVAHGQEGVPGKVRVGDFRLAQEMQPVGLQAAQQAGKGRFVGSSDCQAHYRLLCSLSCLVELRESRLRRRPFRLCAARRASRAYH